MPTPLEKAREFLEKLEADRRNALQVSEQKAEEAKLIKARQEGFQAAIEMLGITTSVGDARASDAKAPAGQRIRRPIRQIILRELSFSGQAMTARQIAEGIGYNLERTEMALERLKQAGRLLCDGGRWAIAPSGLTQVNEPAVSVSNGKLRTSAEA